MKRIISLALLSLSLWGDNEYKLRPVSERPTISLQQALSLAQENNLELKKERAKLVEARSKVWLSATKLLPEFSLFSTHELIAKPGLDKTGASFTLPLFDAKAALETKAHKETLESAHLNADFARQKLIHRVADLYAEALMAKSVLDVAREEQEKFLKQQHVIERKAQIGTARTLDVTTAVYQANKSMSDSILKERDYQRKLADLGAELALRDAFDIAMFSIESPTLALDPSLLVSLAGATTDVKALQRDLASNKVTRASEAWGFLPTLKASGESGWHLGADPKFFSTELMLKLDLPLFNGGSSLARLKMQRAQIFTSELTLRQKEAEKYLSVYGALDQINAYQKAKESSVLAHDAATQAADSAERLFARGELTALNLMDANVQLFSAKNQLVEATLKLIQSQLSLLFLVGKIGDISP